MSIQAVAKHTHARWKSVAEKARKKPEGRLFIDGRYVDAKKGGRIESVNPATGEVIAEVAAGTAEDIDEAIGKWLAAGDFARLKLWTIHRLLGWRALHPQLFEAGDYRPVPVSGPRARHCVAYVRSNARHGVLVLATRLYRELGYPAPDDQGGPAAVSWDDTVVDLAAAGIRAVNPKNLLLAPTADDATGTMASLAEPAPVASLLDRLPIAVISFDVDRS